MTQSDTDPGAPQMPDADAQLQAALADRYRIEREPGRGGMATVYPLDRLEPLLGMPYTLTPAWLRVDPMFGPIRKHPRFVKLIEGTA